MPYIRRQDAIIFQERYVAIIDTPLLSMLLFTYLRYFTPLLHFAAVAIMLPFDAAFARRFELLSSRLLRYRLSLLLRHCLCLLRFHCHFLRLFHAIITFSICLTEILMPPPLLYFSGITSFTSFRFRRWLAAAAMPQAPSAVTDFRRHCFHCCH